MKLIFEWDIKKAKSNFRKHGVDFHEARTIFSDPSLYTFKDDFHSEIEDRYISIGASIKNKVLLVVHLELERSSAETVIRIISSRKATRNERKVYEEERE